MRKGVEHPTTLVDVTALPSDIDKTAGGGVLIGAAVRNTALAAHPLVRTRYPVLSRAILAAASTRIRNMATVAGNILQRSRCACFNDPVGSFCKKRIPAAAATHMRASTAITRSSAAPPPDINLVWTGIPDPRSPLGARGIGEVGHHRRRGSHRQRGVQRHRKICAGFAPDA